MRNTVLLSFAVNIAASVDVETVTIAANADDAEEFPDCRADFFEAFNSAIRASKLNVEVCAPFAKKTKREIVQIGRKLEVDLNQTWSCYVGGEKPCGECLACKKRKEALK